MNKETIQKVYHGTSLENLKQISKTNTLISNVGAGVGSWNPGHVYLGTKFSVASAHGYGAGSRYYDQWDGGPPYIILEFNVNKSILCKDPDNNSECETWQESSEKNGQIAVNGIIQLPSDTIVHFIGGEEWEVNMKTGLNNWKAFYQQNKDELFVPGEEED